MQSRPEQFIRALLTRKARPRILACLFLMLLAHALFVNFTHHHSVQRPDGKTPAITQDHHTPREHLPQSGDEHCLACSLQRNLVAQEHTPIFTCSLVLQDVGWQSLLVDPQQTGAFLTAAGRAPPSFANLRQQQPDPSLTRSRCR